MGLVATAVWAGNGWQSVICFPFTRPVWRGAVCKDWHIANAAAHAELQRRK